MTARHAQGPVEPLARGAEPARSRPSASATCTCARPTSTASATSTSASSASTWWPSPATSRAGARRATPCSSPPAATTTTSASTRGSRRAAPPQPDGVDGPAPRRAPATRRARRWPTPYRRLHERDWPIRQATDHGTHEAIYISDPDGNDLELAWDRPQRSGRWTSGAACRAAATTSISTRCCAWRRASGSPGPWTRGSRSRRQTVSTCTSWPLPARPATPLSPSRPVGPGSAGSGGWPMSDWLTA